MSGIAFGFETTFEDTFGKGGAKPWSQTLHELRVKGGAKPYMITFLWDFVLLFPKVIIKSNIYNVHCRIKT